LWISNKFLSGGGIGTLYEIDYEGIDRSLQQWQYDFDGAFSGAWELGRALKNGLRGNDLILALFRDFKVWQVCPPDRYKHNFFALASH
jgi:hypothetical protein